MCLKHVDSHMLQQHQSVVQQPNGRHDYVLWTSMVKEVTIGEIADMAAGE